VSHPNADAGKGAVEMKQCQDCLFDGNVMGGHLDDNNVIRSNVGGTYFVTGRAEGDAGLTVERVAFSHNLGSGQLPSGAVSCMWSPTMALQDDEHSMKPGSGLYYSHNLHVGCVAPENSPTHLTLQAAVQSGFLHNTFAPDMAQANTYRFLATADCNVLQPIPTYLQNRDVAIRDNILGYGDGSVLFDPPNCWPTRQADLRQNVIVDTEAVGIPAINSAWPGNYAVGSYSGFWAGTCDYQNWLNCQLADTNPQRGAASDGGDPGADVWAIQDRIQRWSEDAGLLIADIGTLNMRSNPSAFTIGSTRAAVRFTALGSSPAACGLELFTTRNRSTPHGDTDGPGEHACSRAGNVIEDNVVTFVLGTNTPLTPGTTYFYKITDGARVMVGEFTTQPAGAGTLQWGVQLAAADTLAYSANADLSGATLLPSATEHRLPVAAGSVVYWRAGAASSVLVAVAP
jgi:hypothetical protein